RPVAELLAAGAEALLGDLTTLRVKHRRLKAPLVNIDRCVQHLPRGLPSCWKLEPRPYRGTVEAPFMTSSSGSRAPAAPRAPAPRPQSVGVQDAGADPSSGARPAPGASAEASSASRRAIAATSAAAACD